MWEGSVRSPCRKGIHSSLSSPGEMQDLGVELVSKQTPHNAVRRKMCGSLEERGGHSARGVLGITGFCLTGFPHKKSQLTMPPISFSLRPAPFPSAMQNGPGPTQEKPRELAHTTRRPCRPPAPACPGPSLARMGDENACGERTRAGGGPASLAGRENLLEAGTKFCLQK